MRSASGLSALFVVLVLASGCATYVYERGYDSDYYYRRIEPDAVRYVQMLDRDLQLDRDQARRIERLLQSRARHLLDHTPVHAHGRVYPFPRERRHHRRAVRSWWRDADRHIGRVLSARQADRYYELLREGRLRYDRDDAFRRYDDQRHSRDD